MSAGPARRAGRVLAAFVLVAALGACTDRDTLDDDALGYFQGEFVAADDDGFCLGPIDEGEGRCFAYGETDLPAVEPGDVLRVGYRFADGGREVAVLVEPVFEAPAEAQPRGA